MDTSWIDSRGNVMESRIIRREPLYKGMNGKTVERVYVTQTESYILKPLTNDSQSGAEAWVYEHLLPRLSPVYPKLLAKSPAGGDLEQSWTLFEDLGPLQHSFDLHTAMALMPHIVHWQALSIDIPAFARLNGPKPNADRVAAELLENRTQLINLARDLNLPQHSISPVLDTLEREGRLLLLDQPLVLSHGDLHLGNYALVNGVIKVLDWEHAHLNIPYWDLYHVIDMSHPTFPKAMTPANREKLLDGYVAAAAQRNGQQQLRHTTDPALFKRSYYLFAAVYSLWMLRLIAQDIEADAGIWPLQQLQRQLNETSASLMQCVRRL
ncbi:phosphotransferase [Paenibacillus harenae]|uniref:phosphotransferase n=1 Tax=Paenibacillus harenae TaxID=306543 RepID=UPI002792FDF3|nr:phosphotransferase [Paenibacillus harenae]MDQ0058819.1 hypothetical protein [Paenibacillus harenae]